ncbi:hypothetical protein BKA82DRAFT_669386 [Pisolithus tinctorius]|uniref:Uncharacterized protein n=1 Tax=Pisolithus tinctorius Marx 270 TaxID=870435 RepID=A0A0C3NNI2_PISTI|nr:hypothetical protein BKA82DRAFT_669386 [Pisolithus tinctorius]KIO02430.1 hypothetical protein M404DRAFT_669386 [Pisolithus tinctorius Marx 270]
MRSSATKQSSIHTSLSSSICWQALDGRSPDRWERGSQQTCLAMCHLLFSRILPWVYGVVFPLIQTVALRFFFCIKSQRRAFQANPMCDYKLETCRATEPSSTHKKEVCDALMVVSPSSFLLRMCHYCVWAQSFRAITLHLSWCLLFLIVLSPRCVAHWRTIGEQGGCAHSGYQLINGGQSKRRCTLYHHLPPKGCKY